MSRSCWQVAQSQRYILGPEVEAFEKEIAAYLGVKHAIGMASGTDALILSLKACGAGHGDEVITCDYSFFSSAGVISWVGAKPVFVDIAKDSFNINASLIEAKISQKTKAILVVHLFGEPAEMDEVMKVARKHKLPVIEDACQAIGSEYKSVKTGGIGDAVCYSFYPTKAAGRVRRRRLDGGQFRQGLRGRPGFARAWRAGIGRPQDHRHQFPAGRAPGRGAEDQAAASGKMDCGAEALRGKIPRACFPELPLDLPLEQKISAPHL